MLDPLRVLTAEAGFFTTREAKNAGYGDRDIARMVRAKHWRRFRRGAYAFADEWARLDAVGQHRVRCNAVVRSLGTVVALSHVSGVVRHGIDVWDVPLDKVHVTRLDGGAGRVEGDVVHHEGFAIDDDVTEVGGQLVLRPERCVLEAASRASNEVALCLLEAGLRAGAFDKGQLEKCHQQLQFWPFMRHLHVPVRMADPRAGSVGESRGNWIFFALGIPAPDLQFEVLGPDGRVLGVTDWYWERYRLLGEFDGRIKYGRLLKPDQDPGDVVFEEKKREDLLREITGCGMLRLVWSDYEEPWSIRRRFERLAHRVG